ncbi:MerR family transcriptional regulator [Lactobacillaceae bacterium L1_55_11]|nr:MerR family transcriptional regulator [Lactobacillaceae bacterium L1_55_11]
MNIKAVAQQTGLSIGTIRYYEKIGLLPEIARDANGIRNFDNHNVQQLDFIKTLRNSGMRIAALKEYLSLVYADDDASIPRRQAILQASLAEIEDQMAKLQTGRDCLRYKLANYESFTRPAEQKVSQ